MNILSSLLSSLFRCRFSLAEFTGACDEHFIVLIDEHHFQRVYSGTISNGFAVIYRFEKSVLSVIYSREEGGVIGSSLGKADIGSNITGYQEGYEHLLLIEELCDVVDPTITFPYDIFIKGNNKITIRKLMHEYLSFVACAIEACAPDFLSGDTTAIYDIAHMKR